jgi:hypothetical protein
VHRIYAKARYRRVDEQIALLALQRCSDPPDFRESRCGQTKHVTTITALMVRSGSWRGTNRTAAQIIANVAARI